MNYKEVNKFEAIFDVFKKANYKPVQTTYIQEQTNLSFELIYNKMSILKEIGFVSARKNGQRIEYIQIQKYSFSRMIELIEQYRRNKKDVNYQITKQLQFEHQQEKMKNEAFNNIMNERRVLFKKYNTIPIIY